MLGTNPQQDETGVPGSLSGHRFKSNFSLIGSEGFQADFHSRSRGIQRKFFAPLHQNRGLLFQHFFYAQQPDFLQALDSIEVDMDKPPYRTLTLNPRHDRFLNPEVRNEQL